MGYAEKIYERVKLLPDPVAEEVLDFTEFVATRRAEAAAPVEKSGASGRRAKLFLTYACPRQPQMSYALGSKEIAGQETSHGSRRP